jgi:pyruvate dehydrogenase E2 component (dihydrolipoamide acetyltransferase)
MRLFCKLFLSVLFAASLAARAQAPAAAAPAKAEPAPQAAAKAEQAPADPAAPKAEPARPYVDSAIAFLKAFTHINRTGPEGEKAWAELRAVSADKVPLKVAGKDIAIDAVGGQSDAQLIRFAKVSTWREGLDVQGVTIEKAQLHVGDGEHTGKARLKLAEKDGKWIVQSLEVD